MGGTNSKPSKEYLNQTWPRGLQALQLINQVRPHTKGALAWSSNNGGTGRFRGRTDALLHRTCRARLQVCDLAEIVARDRCGDYEMRVKAKAMDVRVRRCRQQYRMLPLLSRLPPRAFLTPVATSYACI